MTGLLIIAGWKGWEPLFNILTRSCKNILYVANNFGLLLWKSTLYSRRWLSYSQMFVPLNLNTCLGTCIEYFSHHFNRSKWHLTVTSFLFIYYWFIDSDSFFKINSHLISQSKQYILNNYVNSPVIWCVCTFTKGNHF